ncbi:MAG: DNA-directed polymerase subunit beta, partial [Thermoanaerobacterium sp.]|nr:DNA-directed polymerase subunit beta [Thermoanaerobacterium sp.]
LIAKGEILTPHALSLIKNHKIDYINIKSPLTDTTPIGLSGTSFGLDENSRIPSIGTNLGVKQTQAITEPLSQGALNFFHTGGVTSTDSTMSTYEAINTMTKLTETFQSNSAVLSLVTDTVEKINKKPLGGYEVTIGGVKHDIPTGLEPKVKVGDKVKKGEPISTGMVHPEEAYKARGLPYAEQIMAKQFRDVLKQDLNIDSASIETLVKGLISTAQILDPGNHADEFKIGDVANSQYIDYLNRKDTLTTKKVNSDLIGWVVGDNYGYINIGTPIDENILKELQEMGLKEIQVYKQNIKFQPIIKGTTVLPHKKFDWLHRATFRNLKQVFPEEAAFGGKANIHGPSPLTAWTYGAEIRKDEKGQY